MCSSDLKEIMTWQLLKYDTKITGMVIMPSHSGIFSVFAVRLEEY